MRIAAEIAIPSRIYAMDVKEARYRRLLELKAKFGTLKEVANQIIARTEPEGKKKAARKKYLDRYLSQIHTRGRNMGHKVARKIEVAFGKPKGWMDYVGASSKDADDLLRIWGQFPEEEQKRIVDELRFRLRALKDKDFIVQELGDNANRPPKDFS